MRTVLKNLIVPIAFSAFVGINAASAATYEATATGSWLNSIWDEVGGGATGTVPAAGNDYESGFLLRSSPAGQTGAGTTNFAGDSLTMRSGTTFLMKQTNGQTASIQNGAGKLYLQGATINVGPDGASSLVTLNVSEMNLTGDSILTSARGFVDTFAITGLLTGSGNLNALVTTGSGTLNERVTYSFAGLSNYSGTITVDDLATLSFTQDVNFGTGSLNLRDQNANTDGMLNVSNNITFAQGNLMAGGTIVGAGTYSGTSLADLNTSLGGTWFVDNGGTLTVVPEPQTAAMLMGLGAIALTLVVRRTKLRQ